MRCSICNQSDFEPMEDGRVVKVFPDPRDSSKELCEDCFKAISEIMSEWFIEEELDGKDD